MDQTKSESLSLYISLSFALYMYTYKCIFQHPLPLQISTVFPLTAQPNHFAFFPSFLSFFPSILWIVVSFFSLICDRAVMGRLWTFLTYVHSAAGPTVMLLYPLYASVLAIETPSKLDDEQWLAYWILYSFLTLVEIVLQPILEWIPVWYTLKLAFVAWLVLPQFRGSAFIYNKFVREKIIKKYGLAGHQNQKSPNAKAKGKSKSKFVDFIIPKKARSCYPCSFSICCTFGSSSFISISACSL